MVKGPLKMKQSVNLPKTGQAMKKHRSVMAENAEKEEMNEMI